MGKSPNWVMQKMDSDQVTLCLKKINEQKLRELETQAGIIWLMASGDYKRPGSTFSPEEVGDAQFYEEL